MHPVLILAGVQVMRGGWRAVQKGLEEMMASLVKWGELWPWWFGCDECGSEVGRSLVSPSCRNHEESEQRHGERVGGDEDG